MKKGLLLSLLLVLVLGTMAHAAGVEVNAGYLFGTYDDGIDPGNAPGFFAGVRANVTEQIGLVFNYQTAKLSTYEDKPYSGVELLGSYRLMATDNYIVSVLGGWKTVNDESWTGEVNSGALAIGAEVLAPVSDLATLRGSFVMAPSITFSGEKTSVTRLEAAAAFKLPGLPVQAEAGYRTQSYKYDGDTCKLGGLFIGARTNF